MALRNPGYRVAFLVPAYNEEETIERALKSIPLSSLLHELNSATSVPKALKTAMSNPLQYEADLIVVDDGSTDKTAEIARKYTHHVISLESNCGVGEATKRGLQYIAELGGYDFVIKFDADGQHDLMFITLVIGELRRNDLVLCSRFHKDSEQAQTPIDRVLLNVTLSELIKRITGWQLTDVRTGFMGFRFEYVPVLAERIITKRYGIPMEIILRIWEQNNRAFVSELPHPALYDQTISNKLGQKYGREKRRTRAKRLTDAYDALLAVIENMGLAQEVFSKSDLAPPSQETLKRRRGLYHL